MTAIADALAAMAEGRRAPISPAKGHTGGTTPVEDVSVDDVVESLVDSSDDSQPKPHARRHRHRRRKSPSQGSDSERRATSAESQDMYPNESSPGANGEQPQRDSNPCLHLESAFGPFSRVGSNRCSPVQWGWRPTATDRIGPSWRELSSNFSSKTVKVETRWRQGGVTQDLLQIRDHLDSPGQWEASQVTVTRRR